MNPSEQTDYKSWFRRTYLLQMNFILDLGQNITTSFFVEAHEVQYKTMLWSNSSTSNIDFARMTSKLVILF